MPVASSFCSSKIQLPFGLPTSPSTDTGWTPASWLIWSFCNTVIPRRSDGSRLTCLREVAGSHFHSLTISQT